MLDSLSQRSWNTIALIVLTLGLFWIFISAAPGSGFQPGIPAPYKGFRAPDLVLPDPTGQLVDLGEYVGQPVLVNFWASWCGPCQAEMAAMQEVYTDYREQGFQILAVNTTYQDSSSAALEFAAQRGLTFPILLDESGAAARAYQVRAMPTSFFVTPDGKISSVIIGGPMSEALLRAQIEELLAEVP